MTLPVKNSEVYGGFAVLTGVVRNEQSGLIFEYQLSDPFEIFKGKVQSFELSVSQVESIELKHGWFKDKLYITERSLTLLDEFPVSEANTIQLTISKKYRQKAEVLRSSILLAVSEHRLHELDEEDSHQDSEKTHQSDRTEIRSDKAKVFQSASNKKLSNILRENK